jgi:hypothetical protein
MRRPGQQFQRSETVIRCCACAGLTSFLPLAALLAVAQLGCDSPSAQAPLPADDRSEQGAASHDEHAGHSHGPGHELFWQRRGIEYAGCRIDLGHHGVQVYAAHALEPAVCILRDDAVPVDDAKVFVSLLDFEKQNTLAKEVGTIYQPPAAAEPAHYAQGELPVPAGLTRAVIRYRIALSGADAAVFDVPVEVKEH